MPAVSPDLIEPIWEQFCALLPERHVDHPLGCHRPRIPDRVVFEKLVQVLVFGSAYWRIAEQECSASILRRRRDEWIEAGAMAALERIAKETYEFGPSVSSSQTWLWTAALPRPLAVVKDRAEVR